MKGNRTKPVGRIEATIAHTEFVVGLAFSWGGDDD